MLRVWPSNGQFRAIRTPNLLLCLAHLSPCCQNPPRGGRGFEPLPSANFVSYPATSLSCAVRPQAAIRSAKPNTRINGWPITRLIGGRRLFSCLLTATTACDTISSIKTGPGENL